MDKSLRVLICQDSEKDVELILDQLRRGGFEPRWKRIPDADAMSAALRDESWDAVISDYQTRQLTASDALRILREKGLDLPFIIVSGKIGEEAAVAAMKQGAHDYVTKGSLERLAPAVEREIAEAAGRRQARAAEAAIYKSEEQFRTLFNCAQDAIFIHDMQGHFLAVNDWACEQLGYAREELLKMTPWDIATPQSSAKVSQCLEELGRRGSVVFEFDQARRDGGVMHVEINARLVEFAGRQAGMCIGRDITERKRAEEEIRRLSRDSELVLRSAGEGLFGLDDKGRMTFVNPAAARMLGYSVEELIGRSSHENHHHTRLDGSSYPREQCPIYAAFRDGLVHNGDDEVFWRKDGSSFPVEYFSNPIRDEDGALCGAVVVFHDITERRRAEADRLARESAEAANHAKSEFLASMSHELRTPLNAVIGFSEALEDRYFGDLTEKQSQYVRYIVESGRHLLDLINDILDLSKVESGKMTLELGPVPVRETLENSLIMIKEKCFKHRIALALNVAPELNGMTIVADARKAKQILFNVLSNSAKFTPDGGSITVTASAVSPAKPLNAESNSARTEEPPWIEISVADTGIGIPRELQKRIFEPFYQVKGGTKDKTQGTGLGLSLTKRLVELHGGKITLESEGENKGCRVTFWLPIRHVDQQQRQRDDQAKAR